MALPCIRRLVTSLSSLRPRLDPRSVHVGFVVDEIVLEQDFLPPNASVSPCQYHSTNAPWSSSSLCCSYQKDKRSYPGNLRKCRAVPEIVVHWLENYFHLLFS